jgi:tetratricopeptide (TPR) repeat protein
MTGLSSLDLFDFGGLLQALAQSLRVGTLRVKSGSREKYIYLNRGQVEAVYTPRSMYRVGRILYNMKALELDELREVLESQQSGCEDGQLGELLLRRKLIEEGDLEAALRYQVVEEVIEIFYWKDVRYEFFPGPLSDVLEERVEEFTRVGGTQDAGGMLLQVTKILDDVEQFNKIAPSLKDIYQVVEDVDDYLASEGRPEYLQSLLKLIDGCRDVGELLREMRMNRFEVMERFCSLRHDGVIRPLNAFELFMLAENLREDIPADKRCRIYERVAELGVDGFDITLRLAQCYEELGEGDKAADCFLEHSRSLIEAGDIDAAETAAARAVTLAPKSTDARWFHVGVLRRMEMDEAAAAALFELARIHRSRKEHAKAEDALLAALSIRPDSERLALARIEVLTDLGERSHAASIWVEVSKAREAERDLDGAHAALQEAVKLCPGSLRIHNAQANLLALSGDREGAAASIGSMIPIVIEKTGERPERTLRILRSFRRRLKELKVPDSPTAIALAEANVSLGETDAARDILNEAGEHRIAKGDIQGARDLYVQAVELAPDDLDLAETLALVHSRLGAREDAVRGLRHIADLFRKNGNEERAEKAYREILRLDPFSPDIVLAYAELKVEQGDRKEAAASLHQVGQLYRSAGIIEEAAEHIDQACRLDPSNPLYVRSLAEVLAHALKGDRSVDPLEKLLAMLRARNDHTGSIDVALKILAIDPEHKLAAGALKGAYESLGSKVQKARPAREPARGGG